MDANIFVAAAGLAVAVVGLVTYHWSLSAEISEARHETSRFPLFAARTALVRLILDGHMEEGDPAWTTSYREVNVLLRLDQKLNIWDFSKRYIVHLYRLERDKRVRAHQEAVLAERKAAGQRVPEFAAVQRQINEAILHVITTRSTPHHHVLVWMLTMALQATAFTLRMLFGSSNANGGTPKRTVARVARAALRRPSPGDLQSFACC